MSGETEAQVSGWTVDTLHTHVMRQLGTLRELMDERDVRYQQRYDASQKALDSALLSADKRFELLNELRAGVATSDQIDAVEKVILTLTSRIDRAEARLLGAGDKTRGIYAALAAGVAILSIVVIIANNIT